MARVTVIIPAYNAARTLKGTVGSVLSQTLKDICVLIVDDGSTDETPEIADRLAKEDTRVEVIHQSNTGCYGARLAGMKKVKSQYFGFVDSDDQIEPTMYEKLLVFAEENNLDIAQCDWRGNRRNDGVPQIFGTRQEVVDKVVKSRLIEGVDSMMVWDKIYRNQYDFSKWINGYFATHEDLIHNMQLFLPVKRVGYLNEELYLYEVTGTSSVRNFSDRRIEAFRNTIKVHGQLISEYGLNQVESNVLEAKWIVKNVRNLLILACIAQSVGFRDSICYVRTLLKLQELSNAMKMIKGTEDKSATLLRIVGSLPLPVVIGGIRIAYFLRNGRGGK